MVTAIPNRDFSVRPGGNLKKAARRLDAEIAARPRARQERDALRVFDRALDRIDGNRKRKG